MKRDFAALAPYIVILGMDFYLLPLLAKNTGTAILLMLCAMPLIAFIAAVVYGARRGFHIVLPIVAALLFIPTIFIYYNSSAWIYTAVYGAVVLAGTGTGRIFYRKR